MQLRDKNASMRELIKRGKQLQNVLEPIGIPLIINDYIAVALEVGAAGVHLGQSDGSVRVARKMLGDKAIIGLSVETMKQAKAAQNEEVSYIAASPVFQTKSKRDCKTPWGLAGLKQLCAFSRHPVIAIGGIHTGNVRKVISQGAFGVAIIGAIYETSSPFDSAMKMIHAMKGIYV